MINQGTDALSLEMEYIKPQRPKFMQKLIYYTSKKIQKIQRAPRRRTRRDAKLSSTNSIRWSNCFIHREEDRSIFFARKIIYRTNDVKTGPTNHWIHFLHLAITICIT